MKGFSFLGWTDKKEKILICRESRMPHMQLTLLQLQEKRWRFFLGIYKIFCLKPPNTEININTFEMLSVHSPLQQKMEIFESEKFKTDVPDFT